MRKLAIRIAEAVTFLLLLPLLLWSRLPVPEFSSFTAPSQLLSFIPGVSGILIRRVWYRHTLKRCGTNLTIEWLAVIRSRQSEVGSHCTLGIANWAGWIKLGDDVMTGSHVVLLSGGRQHGFSDTTVPIRQQHGGKRQLHVGSDAWIGAHSVVLEDINSGTVVGAGSIVTKTFPPRAVIVGNPARLLRLRTDPRKSKNPRKR